MKGLLCNAAVVSAIVYMFTIVKKAWWCLHNKTSSIHKNGHEAVELRYTPMEMTFLMGWVVLKIWRKFYNNEISVQDIKYSLAGRLKMDVAEKNPSWK